MIERFAYPANVRQDSAGFVLVTFPDFPEAGTDAPTEAEALAQAADCLEEAIAGRINRDEEIPEPSSARGRPLIAPGALIAAKAALYAALRKLGMSQVELARRIGVDGKVVRRLLDPRHTSKLGNIERALHALGQRLEVHIYAA